MRAAALRKRTGVEGLPASVIGSGVAAALFAIVVAVLIVRRRRHARRAAEDAHALVLAGSVPHMIWTATSRGAVDYANGRFADYAGIASDELSAAGWEGLLDPRDRAQTMAGWNAAVAAETPFRAEARLRRADGVHRFHLLLADPARDASGAVVRWFGSCTDIEDHKGGERMLAVLAEVTQAVSRSLDQLKIARALADLVVPRELAYCEILLFGPDARLYQAVSAGDAARFDDERRARAARVQRAGAMLVTRGLSVVPAALGDEILGWFVCCDVASDVHALVPELALRLGAAIANANAYAREHRVATSFQRAALDEDVPDVPGLCFSVLYHAAHSEASVGGDWYDAFRLPDGRVVLSVGDVAGSGLEAAVTMASVRQSIRTAALINPDPKAVLDAVDRIVRAMGHNRFVTAFVGVLDPVCSELVFASAGHPPPLVRDPGGRVTELAHGDLPLGLRQATDAEATVIALESGSMVVAYTDGLTEFERDPETAHRRLLEAVRREADGGAETADRLFAAVAEGRPTHDDVAILVVTFAAALTEIAGERGATCWTFDATDVERASAVRREYLAQLRNVGFSTVELYAAQLVFGELIGNVCRYAPPTVDVMLDNSGSAAVLHVLDSGEGFEFRPRLPADPLAERGRGLFLVKAFADELSMERRRTGGSHARAVLLGRTRYRAASTMTRAAL